MDLRQQIKYEMQNVRESSLSEKEKNDQIILLARKLGKALIEGERDTPQSN